MASKVGVARSIRLFLHYPAFVNNFTLSDNRLVFSLNRELLKLMSKPKCCMYLLTKSHGSPCRIRMQLSEIYRNFFILGTLLCGAWVAGCGSHSNMNMHPGTSSSGLNEEAQQRAVRRGLPSEPLTLDPQLADDTYSNQVVRDLYEGLTAEDRHGQIVPGVASSWTVDTTGTIYTFQLRPEARWSDGSPVVAEEFVQGLRRAVDPKAASGSAALLAIIRGASDIAAGRKGVSDLRVSALGPYSVQIELEHPAPFLLQILTQPIGAPFQSTKIGSKTIDPRTGKGPATNGLTF